MCETFLLSRKLHLNVVAWRPSGVTPVRFRLGPWQRASVPVRASGPSPGPRSFAKARPGLTVRASSPARGFGVRSGLVCEGLVAWFRFGITRLSLRFAAARPSSCLSANNRRASLRIDAASLRLRRFFYTGVWPLACKNDNRRSTR